MFEKNTKANWEKEFQFPKFFEFCSNSKRSTLISIIFLLIAFGIKIFHLSISHDTEAIISVPQSLYNSWYTMGRFGLILMKKLSGTYIFNPYVASIFMFLIMIGITIIWSYLFYCFSKNRKHFLQINWIFSVMLLTPPIMVEQVGFLLQAYEVCLALLLIGIALICVYKAILQKKNFYYIPMFALTIISFSCYQTLVPLYVAGAIACFILIYDTYYTENKGVIPPKGFLWGIILKLILSFFLSFILYQVINKIILNRLNMKTTSYISNQILWRSLSKQECISNIINHIKRVVAGDGVFYSMVFAFAVGIIILYVIIRIKNMYKMYYLYILAVMMLLISPFFMTILMGNEPTYRTQLVLPFVTGFLLQYIINRFPETKGNKVNYLYGICIIAVSISAMSQSLDASRMFYTEYLQYEEDVRIATKITDRIDQLNLGERPNEPLVIVGSRTPQLNKSAMRDLEMIGKSYYEVAFTTEYGSFIMRNFMSAVGYEYQSPSKEQIKQAEIDAIHMGSWPNTDSVQAINGVIIVKLSSIY